MSEELRISLVAEGAEQEAAKAEGIAAAEHQASPILPTPPPQATSLGAVPPAETQRAAEPVPVQPAARSAAADREAASRDEVRPGANERAARANAELQAELELEARRAMMAEYRRLTDARIAERLAVEKMTEDERLDHEVEQEVKRQRRAEERKQLVYDTRYAQEPEFRAQEQAKGESQRRREQERQAQQAEEVRRLALGEQGRADEDAREEVESRKVRHEARMKADEEYRARVEAKAARDAERDRREALGEQGRADEDARLEVERRQHRHEAMMREDEEYRKRHEAKAAREAEAERRAAMSEQERADEDAREAVQERERRHQARMKADGEYRQKEADRVYRQEEQAKRAEEQARRESLSPFERAVEDARKKKEEGEIREQADRAVNPEKWAKRDQEQADKERYEWAGPFAPTLKRYAKMADAFFGKKEKRAEEAPEPEPAKAAEAAPETPTARPATATEQQGPYRRAEPAPSTRAPSPASAAEAGEVGETAGAGSALAEAVPIIGAAVAAVEVLGQAAGAVEKMADLQVRRQEIMMQGGPHQTSELMENSAQQQSAMVDWIPVIGPALGKLTSFGTEMASKAIRMVEDVAIEAADTMRGASQAAASVLTFDSKALVNQFGELAERRLPILGAVVHGATDSVLAFDHAIESSAKKMSEFHGGLAVQQGQEEVALLLRDMQRAQRFGDQAQQAEAARFGVEMRLAQITDRFVPFVQALGTELMTVVSGGLDMANEVLKAILKTLDFILEHAVVFMGWWAALPPVAGVITNIRDLIRRALEDSVAGEDFITQEWNRMRETNRRASFPTGAGLSAPQALPMPGV